MYSVIIAGGSGQRLWPLSTFDRPKPLLEISYGKTLFSLALERAQLISSPEKILLVITEEIRNAFLEALPSNFPSENILIEPMGRNTAPCAALAAQVISRRDPEAVMGLFPADHLIQNTIHFADCLREAARLAGETEQFVLLGLKPREPSTEYGYILLKEQLDQHSNGIPVYRSGGFLEKPPLKKAAALIAEKKALWNSGIYVAQATRFLQEMQTHLPPVYEGISRYKPGTQDLAVAYSDFPSISIDYAITEKLPSFLVLATSLDRVDVGHFNSFYELWEKDEKANAVDGDLIQIDSAENIVHGSNRPIALVGIKNMVIMDTPDALLICPRDQLHRIKEIREKCVSKKRGEK